MKTAEKHLFPGRRVHQTGTRDILTVLFKRKSVVVTVFSMAIVLGLALSFLIPPTYEARSSLLIKLGREYVGNPGVGELRALMLEHQEIMNSEIKILASRELIEKVISLLKIETIYPKLAKRPPAKMTPLEASIMKFEKSLSVEAIRKSSVIEVSFRHRDPKIAASAVNLLVDLYREKHLRVFSDPQSSFLEKQMQIYKKKLGDSENNLEDFKQRNRVYSLEEQRSLLLRQQADLDGVLKNTKHRIEELGAKLASLRQQRAQSATKNRPLYTNTERDKIIVDAKAKLLSLQLTEQDLLKRYREDSRRVQDVRAEMRTVKNFLQEQEADIGGKMETGNRVYQETEIEMINAEADMRSQSAKAVSLTQLLGQVGERIRTLDLNERKIQNLKREMSANEKYFKTYEDRLEEARISEDMNRNKLANISVIQPAAVPPKPLRPRKLLNMVLSLFIGVFGGLVLAFAAEQLSQGISTPEGVEKRLGLPVLTTISIKEA